MKFVRFKKFVGKRKKKQFVYLRVFYIFTSWFEINNIVSRNRERRKDREGIATDSSAYEINYYFGENWWGSNLTPLYSCWGVVYTVYFVQRNFKVTSCASRCRSRGTTTAANDARMIKLELEAKSFVRETLNVSKIN